MRSRAFLWSVAVALTVAAAIWPVLGGEYVYDQFVVGPISWQAENKAVDYQALLQGVDAGSARPYITSERFRAKEIINHHTFGVGFVVGERDSNKIDVGFTDGIKTLTHGASAAR